MNTYIYIHIYTNNTKSEAQLKRHERQRRNNKVTKPCNEKEIRTLMRRRRMGFGGCELSYISLFFFFFFKSVVRSVAMFEEDFSSALSTIFMIFANVDKS